MTPQVPNPTFTISIVVPIYNEEGRIYSLFDAIKDFLDKSQLDFELILVNDGSTDNSLKIIRTNTVISDLIDIQKCIIIDNSINKGKGEAIKRGVIASKGNFILTMDADISTHPLEMIKWLEREKGIFENNIIYIGSRELKGSQIKSGYLRRSIGRIFNMIVRSITKLKSRDTQCGFKLYPAFIGKKIFSALVNTGWAHDIELLCRARNEGYTIKEMEITWASVDGGKVSVMKDSLKMLMEVIRISKLVKK